MKRETLVTWDSKLIDFLSNNNTIIIKNKEEFNKFTKKMETVGLATYRLKTPMEIQGELLVEYNNNKGFTYWNCDKMLSDAIEDSYKWFGIEPLDLKEIL